MDHADGHKRVRCEVHHGVGPHAFHRFQQQGAVREVAFDKLRALINGGPMTPAEVVDHGHLITGIRVRWKHCGSIGRSVIYT